MRCASASHQPASTSQTMIAERAERPGADVANAATLLAADRGVAERQEGRSRQF